MASLRDYVRAHCQSLISIMIRGAAVVAGFFITYHIGHTSGPAANGQYGLIVQTAMFLSIVAVGGMDLAVVRHFSATLAFHVPLGRASLRRALGYSLGAGCAIVVILACLGPLLLPSLPGGQLPAHGFTVLALILLVRTTTRLTAAVLRSQDHQLAAQIIEVLAIPAMVVVLILAQVVTSVEQVLAATAIVGVATACFGVWRCTRDTTSSGEALDVRFGSLLRTSLPLWLTGIALNISEWYALATAAATLGVYDAGLFRVAFQIGGALTFCAMGIYNVFTARISAAIAIGDVERVARLSRAATRLSVVVLLPAVIGLLGFGGRLLALIGPEFRAAAPLLEIMLVGQLVYVATGPAGLVLAMTGHERLNLAIASAVTGGMLVLAPIAAHLWGLYGLAVVTACVPVCGNIANLVSVYRLEKISIVAGRYFGEPRERLA